MMLRAAVGNSRGLFHGKLAAQLNSSLSEGYRRLDVSIDVGQNLRRVLQTGSYCDFLKLQNSPPSGVPYDARSAVVVKRV